MKICVVGKLGNITHWMEHLAFAADSKGHDTSIFSVKGISLIERFNIKYGKIFCKNFNEFPAQLFLKHIRKHKPDIIFFIGAFHTPQGMYDALSELKNKPICIGWVGDKFSKKDIPKGTPLDFIYFTDSGFFDLAVKNQLSGQLGYLPLACNPHYFSTQLSYEERDKRLLFIAHATSHREAILKQFNKTALVIGPKWNKRNFNATPHFIRRKRRISPANVAKYYGSHLAVINILNEAHAINNLSQRSFEPCAAGSIVVNEHTVDLERCFEIGKETLSFSNGEELNDNFDRILADSKFAKNIAQAGKKRVLAEHTFAHRLQHILDALK